jgi:hypothetical protein
MADQASMTSREAPNGIDSRKNGLGTPRTAGLSSSAETLSPTAVVSSIAGFGENVIGLAELQARLAVIELKQNVSAIKMSVAILFAAAVTAIAGLFVGLLGVAELMNSVFAVSRATALLSLGAVTIGIAGICAAVAVMMLARNPARFPLSSEELQRNIRWIRTVLRHSGRAAPRP